MSGTTAELPQRGLPPRLQRVLDRVPAAAVLAEAAANYIRHQSANQAGHIAFSAVLAIFPFMLFLSAAASILGRPGAAAELARTVATFAPRAVGQTLEPAIHDVLSDPSPTLLTVGIVGTLWAASSGAQAVRIALNRAYGVKQGLSFWKARLKVIVFTIIGTAATVIAVSSVVVLPYLWTFLSENVEHPVLGFWLWIGARYGVAFIVLATLYAIMYLWLPDTAQELRNILPGAVLGALLWILAAGVLSTTLRGAGELRPIYGSLAGVVATLVFLYVSAVTLIFGAEFNAVLRKRRTTQAATSADTEGGARAP